MIELPVIETIKEAVKIGVKNAPSIIGAVVLYVLTCWIPYLNVGTTIAICTIPVELSKGKVISPLFIFDAKYRKNFGEFILLVGLMYLGISIAALFLVIPAIVISIAWSLAIYIFLDKGINFAQALTESNRITYGYKKKMFWINVVLQIFIGICWGIAFGIFSALSGSTVGAIIGAILLLAVCICSIAVSISVSGVIYRKLAYENVDNNAQA
ncbi:MAG: hypothetical protein IKC96_04920 [Paludibacteraceae bacterium]|jgi:hypothetical protein|nr:hypothetical protein [Paludibacteraceae bacterium]